MLTPFTIMAGANELQALIDVLANPDKYKKQVDELKTLAKDADEKTSTLVQERVEVENLKNEITSLMTEGEALVADIERLSERANEVVNKALSEKGRLEQAGAEIINEAKAFVKAQREEAVAAISALDDEIVDRTNQLDALDKDLAARKEGLATIEARLEDLRRRL